MTHTYAILEVSAPTFREIKGRLEASGYAHAFHDDVIDLHGIALKARQTKDTAVDDNTTIEIGTILSHRTKEGMVEFTLNDERTQFDLAKAREVRGMLDGAIEAAVSDGLIFAFLTTKVGLSEEKAVMALRDFREMRQGSRDVVYPS